MPVLLSDVMDLIEKFKRLRNENGSVPGLTSGYKDLDRITTGFKEGEMIVLAARPGHGKTSLALNIAEHVALSANDRRENNGGKDGGVAFFSLEMTGVEVVSRVLCSMAGVDLQRVRRGELNKSDEAELRAAQERLADAPLFVDDSFMLSMAEIRAKSRRLRDRHGIELVVVDYLQLVAGDARLERYEQIGIVSRGLKQLARELKIPVIGLAQLNRQIEQRSGKRGQRPMLSDLRESGSIEQDADMVMFIQREYMLDPAKAEEAREMADLKPQEERDTEPATLIVAKNRSGPIDDVPMMFRKSLTRFESAARGGERYGHG